jgi:hypothetical protein
VSRGVCGKKVCNKRLEAVHLIIVTLLLLIVLYSLSDKVLRGEFPYAEICFIILYYMDKFWPWCEYE